MNYVAIRAGLAMSMDICSYARDVLFPCSHSDTDDIYNSHISCSHVDRNTGAHYRLTHVIMVPMGEVDSISYKEGIICSVLYPISGSSVDYIVNVAKA